MRLGRRFLALFLVAFEVSWPLSGAAMATTQQLVAHPLEGPINSSVQPGIVAEALADGEHQQARELGLRMGSWTPPSHGEGLHDIKYVALIAERHSGSTWMVSILTAFFWDTNIKVMSTLCTWKHWFQDRIHQDIQDGKRTCRDSQMCPACMDMEHTLVIAMWRNPYDWLSGMHHKPHHSKDHANIADFSEFMTMRWMVKPTNELAARKAALIKARDQEPCIDNFLPWEVVPCKAAGGNTAIYELDANGEAYDNVYQLRKAKIRDFNAVKEWAPFYEKILYEDMMVGTGLRDWLYSLETKYDLSGNVNRIPFSSLEVKMETLRTSTYYFNSENCAPNCTFGGESGKEAVHTLHAMWDDYLEEGIGYHRVSPS